MKTSVKCFLLVLFICSSQAQVEFDLESLVDAYGSLFITLLQNQLLVQESASQVAQCVATPDASTSINELAECTKQYYPHLIPADIFDDFFNAKNVHMSICDLPDGDVPGSAALSLRGEDVSELCPEGELFSLDVPVLFNDKAAVYTVSTATSITLLNDADTLATVSDPDGAITSAVSSSTLPPGVSLNSATGAFYVSNRMNLIDGTFTVTVTTTDATTGKTTQTITIVLLAALCGDLSGCGMQCYNPADLDCVNHHLAPKGFLVCDNRPYDPTVYACYSTVICPKVLSACGADCYNEADYTCYGSKLCPKNYHLCGGACFDHTVYECCNDSIDKLCQVGYSCSC